MAPLAVMAARTVSAAGKMTLAIHQNTSSAARYRRSLEGLARAGIKNVELTMADVRKRSAVLADLQVSGAIKILGAMYNLDTGLVEFFG